MDKQGKARRKRKDPESRDFACLCGKSYLSYAAAYTHAKNKHDGQKQFIEGIKKPQRQQLKRGRPKEKKVDKQTTQTAKLTLIESTILKICELLQDKFDHIILEGNQQRSQQDFQQEFKRIKSQFQSYFDYSEEYSRQDQAFVNSIIKDFNAQVAARVQFVCEALSRTQYKQYHLSRKLNQCNLWKDTKGVNEAIEQALEQWRKYTYKNTIENVSEQNQQKNEFDLNI